MSEVLEKLKKYKEENSVLTNHGMSYVHRTDGDSLVLEAIDEIERLLKRIEKKGE